MPTTEVNTCRGKGKIGRRTLRGEHQKKRQPEMVTEGIRYAKTPYGEDDEKKNEWGAIVK